MARMLATSTEWINIQVTHLYRSALDRSPDDGGLVDWRNVILSGALLSEVGASFYGSPEFHLRSGGTNRGFVAGLYRQILGREPDAPGLDDWVRRLDGELDRRSVAASFYASVESRRQRVTDLYRRVLDREPDPSGLAHWSGRLLRIDDVALSEHLVSSYEYFVRAQAS